MKALEEFLINIDESLIDDKKLAQFENYYELLIEKNKVMNLTAITDRDEVVLKHFIDSVALLKFHKLTNEKIIDVGTGAGFPGIPLKIVCPDINVTLFDSLNKRVLFLREVIDELGLSGIEALHGRAEEGGRDKAMREAYDIAVSRAVANMAVLSEYCLPFVRTGGYFIPYKSFEIEEELNEGKKAISILGGKTEKVEKLEIEGNGRSFIFIKKEKPTPKAYPRKAGTAKKQPLA
ncbi:MAG: 16S rRNA (guanine(527)-N(7))-methyltransferase RsmG [Lachnospiraceae bacterium]|nr:16S rRNA (guanine(527)-N(7))-methyltransferase RsmG [Lachnospiraceae bacterium]